MMKVKTNTKKEFDLVAHWLTRFGVNYTSKGFLIEFSTIDPSEWSTIQSAVRLNTESNIDHLELN